MVAAVKLVFTVINDLNYDQRMIRICTSLADMGYDVTLVGIRRKQSEALVPRPYRQKRLPVLAEQGPLFYLSYWFVLFCYLLRKKADVICAIDLDTILSVLYASKIKGCKRVYDAHEIFTEMKEVVTRPDRKKFWEWVAQHSIPQFPNGYTVGNYCAQYLKEHYGVDYPVITNASRLLSLNELPDREEKPFILYQGAVNQGRCFEELIPAMQWVDVPLLVCGQGNFWEQAQELAKKYNVAHKITFRGWVSPDELRSITPKASIGLILLDDKSQNNIFSLANRVFDYMHAAVPQLSMNFPEYKAINEQYEIALLLDAPLTPESIAQGINRLLSDKELYNRLVHNSLKAREVFNWQANEKILGAFYQKLMQQ